jgi:hypothetical protein
MTLTTFPGQPRKTLASQLDRLEDILDHLPATLQSAVSAAVAQAVTQAVQESLPTLLTALLHHPQFLDALHAQTNPAAAWAAPVYTAVRDACRRLGHASRAAWQQLRSACVAWLGQAIQHRPLLAAAGKRLCRWKRRLLWACGMGLATSLVILWAGPWLGVSIGFLAGFVLTLVVQDWQRLRPLLTRPIDNV